MTQPSSSRDLLLALFRTGLRAADPALVLPPHLPEPPTRGRIVVLGAGKAAASMVAAAETFYADRGALARLIGLGVTRHGHGCPTRQVEIVEAGHPVPDEAGVKATERILALAAGAGSDDLVLTLLSGGGSANWIAPGDGLTLDEKRAITRALLRSGAGIGEINTVRKHLSRIKGGRLARLARPARLVTLAMSDVPGDDPNVIASGPTVPDPTTLADARAIVLRRDIALPVAARALLDDPASETVKEGDPAFSGVAYTIVSRPADMIAAVAQAAGAAGYEPVELGADCEGEARVVAAEHARLARDLKSAGRRAAIVSGGELTVTMRGRGRGGPNQEYALALALALAGEDGIAALSADTDGADGGGGSADDPAGAIVDATTLVRATQAGLDARRSLDDNDSTTFFERLGDLVSTGPTRTNVNDCRIILVG